VPITVVPAAEVTPVPADDSGMQTSAVIDPSEQSTVMSPDGKVSVAFQKSSRQSTYQVLVDSSPDNCAGGDQIDGMVYACLTVEVFDAQGDPESGVTLINSASGRIVLSPEEVEELGGLGVLFQTNVLGGLSVVTRDSASDMWTPLTHGLEAMDGGGAAITLSSFRTLGNFALVIDETVRQQALYQVTGAPTPTSVPTPMATATASSDTDTDGDGDDGSDTDGDGDGSSEFTDTDRHRWRRRRQLFRHRHRWRRRRWFRHRWRRRRWFRLRHPRQHLFRQKCRPQWAAQHCPAVYYSRSYSVQDFCF
jgi:hypothetical protein